MSVTDIARKLDVPVESLAWLNEEADSGGQHFWRVGRNDDNEWEHVLSLAGRQVLLNHDHLDHAIRSSQTATWIALSALVVAIIGIGLNVANCL